MKKSQRPAAGLLQKLLVLLVIIGFVVAGLVYYHSIQENPYTSEVFFSFHIEGGSELAAGIRQTA